MSGEGPAPVAVSLRADLPTGLGAKDMATDLQSNKRRSRTMYPIDKLLKLNPGSAQQSPTTPSGPVPVPTPRESVGAAVNASVDEADGVELSLRRHRLSLTGPIASLPMWSPTMGSFPRPGGKSGVSRASVSGGDNKSARGTGQGHRRTTSLEGGRLVAFPPPRAAAGRRESDGMPTPTWSGFGSHRSFAVPASGRAAAIAQARGIVIAPVSVKVGAGLATGDSARESSVSPGLRSGRSSIDIIGAVSPGIRTGASWRAASMGDDVSANMGVTRRDIVLCKFFHTPGLTCTARPCRFVHEIPPSASPSPTTRDFHVSISGPGISASVPAALASRRSSLAGSALDDAEADDAIEELVEIFPMSGGGAGPRGKHGMAKFKSVPCKDFAEGNCLYGDYCSFIHEWPSEVTQEKEEVLVDLRSPAQATTPTPPSIQIQEPSGASRPVAVDTFDPTARKKGTSSKFQHGGISVPDYTWKDDVLLPSSTTSDRFRKLSEVIDWTSELSPRTTTTPAQWATVPPNSVWAKGPPKASGTDDRASATDNQPSPHLPITAFTFDTTSAPATPLDKGQGEESPTGSDQKFAVTPTGSSYRPCTPTGEQEVGVEHHWGARIPKMPIQDLSLAFPFGGRPDMAWQHGYTLGWNSFAQAQLARDSDVKLAEIEPTIPLPLHNHAVGAVPHAEMNYRRRVCTFFLQGRCPFGSACTYKHEVPRDQRGDRQPDKFEGQPRQRGYRSMPCKFFNSAAGCTNGDRCAFLHQMVIPAGMPLILKPRPWRTKPCRHFQRGTCIAGDHCAFAHVLVDEPQTSGSSAPSSPDLAPNEVERLAAPRGKSDIICRWFRSPHGCRNGESCAYSHRLPVKKPSKKNRKAPASNTVTGKTETQANRQAKEAMGSLVLHPVIKSSKFDADRLTAGASANGHDDDEDNIEVIHSDNSSMLLPALTVSPERP